MRLAVFLLFLTKIFLVQAETFVLPDQGDVVGKIEYVNPQIGETLSEVGIRHDVGYYEMLNANPGVDPTRPLPPQTRLVIPSQYILPSGPRSGLVINLSEYRLYYFPPNDNVVITMPVGIGREGWNTPVGQTRVTSKEHDPIWRPTANVRAEAAKHGTPIPNEFPPGAGNPLGRHVFRLGWPTYLIHGTNRRDGVGSRVSAGCIRMLPEDIEVLFDMVAVGTSVRVINEPVKIGRLNNALYIEVHTPLEQNINLPKQLSVALGKYAMPSLNKSQVQEEGLRPSGIPRKVAG